MLQNLCYLNLSLSVHCSERLRCVTNTHTHTHTHTHTQSLEELRRKGTRTVYRLTLVKDRNSHELREVSKPLSEMKAI